MKLKNVQVDLNNNISEVLDTIPDLERKGVDKSIIDEQLEIAEKLSKFSDKLTPIIDDSKKRGFHSHSSKKYREIANAYPRVKKTVLLFLMLFISLMLVMIAIKVGSGFLEPLKNYTNLIKAMIWFTIIPLLLSVLIVAYKTEAFPGRHPHMWIEKNEQPIKYWFLMLLWPSAPIGSSFAAWHWLKAYLNA